ncbi:MAG: PqqD family protein [Ruminococcaceae bacterium]|nr:PqqD family protein [Oscillospiraceae bacterium]
MAKKQKENYLEKIPVRKEKFRFTESDDGLITIEIDNKGFFNRLLQLIAKKPKVSYIHLDENGSFVWKQIDGRRDIIEIGKLVEEHFGEKANPVYERLVKYFAMLQNAGFIEFKN